MEILYITFSPFSNNPGHLSRLTLILNEISQFHAASVLCVGKEGDNENTKARFPHVKFLHCPVRTKGWHLENKAESIQTITSIVKDISPSICVLQMEAWELVRELNLSLRDITTFTTVFHAMPFLVSPVTPTGKFENDVRKYLLSGLEPFRREYVEAHYLEIYETIKTLPFIASNKTVAFYLKSYFDNIFMWELIPYAKNELKLAVVEHETLLYDFVYMARMEAGKGVEFLDDILCEIYYLTKRKVRLLILGRTDDDKSQTALEKLLRNTNNEMYSVDFLGWANNDQKANLLPRCGVFLYPSYYDNYPSVILEALSFGLPVVTWDVPFAFINYSDVKSIKRIALFDIHEYARAAKEALESRNQLKGISLEYINAMPSPLDVALSDIEIYKEIINFNNNGKNK